jgi:photosystem II stability/assembly factor-like uncharacterized protein
VLFHPDAGATFTAGSDVPLEAQITDADGWVTRVDFFEGSTLLGSDSAWPFQWTWSGVPAGKFRLEAIATDNAGSTTTSESVAITVVPAGGPPPAPPPTPVVPQGTLRGVFFADASNGWMVGEAGRIYATTDGGVAWSAQTSGTTATLRRVQFVSTSRGWIVGDGGTILRTTNGGATWTPAPSGTLNDLRGVSFVSAAAGWAVGAGGTILKTGDGGQSWSAQSGSSAFLGAVSFVNERSGWIGGGGDLASTSDGGATWTHYSTAFLSFTGIEHIAFFTDARFVSEKRGVFVGVQRGGDVMFFTSDGGTTWSIHEMNGGFARWNAVAFGDGSHFWAVGLKDTFDQFSPGHVAASTDGGAGWTMQTIPSGTRALNGVWFVSGTRGWAVGEDGTVIRTTDGGATWARLHGGS